MKSYNNLFCEMLKEENIKECFMDASKGKRTRKDVVRVLDDVDIYVKELRNIMQNETFKPSRHSSQKINENNNMKIRKITKPNYKYEQVVHHCVIKQFKPIVMRGLYEFSCGSIPGRGIHYGKKYMRKWINAYKGKKMYILKFDIHHFFESVDHTILKQMLEKTIRDKKFLRLIGKIIDAKEKGLPLGFYTSQWFANFYLKKMDHIIKQDLKATHYMRYMDDCIILGKNKKELHKMKKEIEQYLKTIKLTLKGDWQVFRFEYKDKKTGKTRGRFLDFMGFKFHKKRTGIRKTILRTIRRKILKVDRKVKKTWCDGASILSRLGWFKYTDTYGFYLRHLKSHLNIRLLKKLVSKHQKKENLKNDRMERSNRNPECAA